MAMSTFSTVTFSMAFPSAVEIVCSQSNPPKGQKTGPYPLITEDQLYETYLNPNNQFLREEIAKIGVPLIQMSREYFGRRNKLLSLLQVCEEALGQLRDRIHAEKIDAKQGKEIEKKLLAEQDKIQESLRTLHNVVDPTIKSLRGKFDNLLIKHNKEWRHLEVTYIEQLIQELEQRHLIFENEKRELRQHEILPYFIDRYKQLNLELPVDLDAQE